jgi:hypothetical protein
MVEPNDPVPESNLSWRCVSCRGGSTASVAIISSTSQSSQSEQNPKLTLLELGILLLEIWNEKSFEICVKEHCKIENILPMMRQGLASEWYDCTYMEMTDRYGKVVQTCVNFAFDYNPGRQTWDDEDLRKSINLRKNHRAFA